MDKSLKIGAVAGLLSGIINFFLVIHYVLWMYGWGLPYYNFPPPEYPPMNHIVIVTFTMSIIWGIALGMFYSRIYDVIPGKQVYKGLVYGIILTLIWSLRWMSWDIAYSWIEPLKSDTISLYLYVVFGILLGVLYEIFQKKYNPVKTELSTNKFDVRMGVLAGAIGGLLGGIVIAFAHILFWDPLSFSKYVGDLEFLTAQFGTHAFINMCWGAFFGILYAIFYDKIPGKKISRGIIFGMIIFFITSFQAAIAALLYGDFGTFVGCGNGVFLFFVNGLVLGLLYRKPTEAPSIEKEETQVVKMIKCIHCNASIAKGSEYCSKCGKKQ